MAKLWWALAIVFAVILAAEPGAMAQDAANGDTDKALYAALREAGAIDGGYDRFLQPVLTALLRDAEIEEPLELNLPPRPGTLSVLVVDRKRLAAVRTDHAAVKRLLPNIANNVLAVLPATIVFDKDLIAALTVNGLDDAAQFIQALRAAQKLGPRTRPEAADSEIEKFSALGDIKRYRAIRNNRQNLNSETTANGLMPQIIKMLEEDASGRAIALPRFTMILAPIVLHEIGHLRRGVAGAYQDALGGPLGATVSLILQEETAADDFAIERMQRMIRRMAGDQTVNEADLAMRAQTAMSTIKYMRDDVLEDTFNQFRELSTEDLLITAVHWDCNERKGIEALSLDDPDRVRIAYRGRTPLLTRSEFDEMRTRIRQRIANGTHSHHFIRGDRFLAAIERERQLDRLGMFTSSLAFLEATVRNEPIRLYPNPGTASVGLSFDEISAFWPDAEVIPGATCPEGMCAVVRFKDHAGFAEVTGSMKDLGSVRITFPLLGPKSARQDENPEEYAKYLMFGLLLVHSVVGDQRTGADRAKKKGSPLDAAGQLLTQVRTMSLKCGAGFALKRIGKRLVAIRTLNEKNWVTLDVEPLPPAPPQVEAPKGKRK